MWVASASLLMGWVPCIVEGKLCICCCLGTIPFHPSACSFPPLVFWCRWLRPKKTLQYSAQS